MDDDFLQPVPSDDNLRQPGRDRTAPDLGLDFGGTDEPDEAPDLIPNGKLRVQKSSCLTATMIVTMGGLVGFFTVRLLVRWLGPP